METAQTFRISEVGRIFNRSRQTIGSWVAHEELAEFFSPYARRENDAAESRFTIEDIEVCNSIFVMLKQKATWHTIAENLRSGWRDTDLPETAAHIRPALQTPTHTELTARLALATEQYENSQIVIRDLNNEIRDLRAALDEMRESRSSEEKAYLARISELERQKAVVESQSESAIKNALLVQELEFMRSGRLRPPSSE